MRKDEQQSGAERFPIHYLADDTFAFLARSLGMSHEVAPKKPFLAEETLPNSARSAEYFPEVVHFLRTGGGYRPLAKIVGGEIVGGGK